MNPRAGEVFAVEYAQVGEDVRRAIELNTSAGKIGRTNREGAVQLDESKPSRICCRADSVKPQGDRLANARPNDTAPRKPRESYSPRNLHPLNRRRCSSGNKRLYLSEVIAGDFQYIGITGGIDARLIV